MNTKKTKRIDNDALIKPADGARLAMSEAEQGPRLDATWEETFDSTGGRSAEVAGMLMIQADSLQENGGRTDQTARLALSILEEMEPKNATEGMLAVQMIGVHNAAVEFIKRSLLTGQTVGGVDMNVTRACRLMRLFTEQTNAMAKLRGTAGQQRMTVEHVHVHAGGQAIVGPVAGGNSTPGDEGVQSGKQRNNP